VARRSHVRELERGRDSWNLWRAAHPGLRPVLDQISLVGKDLSDYDLSCASFVDADLSFVNLHYALLNNANFYRTTLRGARLPQAAIQFATFIQADLQDTMAHDCTFEQCMLNGADARRADFSGSTFLNTGMAAINLDEARLLQSYFTCVTAAAASFDNANLFGAKIARSDFHGARFGRAFLGRTEFRDVGLREARLDGTVFDACELTNVDMAGCILSGATFAATSLQGVIGLQDVWHRGPSSISIDTLYLSKDLPTEFLRGAGVPDDFIDYLVPLTSVAVDFSSCFISYSSKDEPFARRLYADLRYAGIRVWFAPEDLKIGDRMIAVIDESIRLHDKLLVVLSKNSLESGWVESEVESALARERRDKCELLFPIRIDDAVMTTERGWAATLRATRHIGDFRQWSEDSEYSTALTKLIADLRKRHASVLRHVSA
jgi:uncharacterized protein YjbI with pentapeptide repeats